MSIFLKKSIKTAAASFHLHFFSLICSSCSSLAAHLSDKVRYDDLTSSDISIMFPIHDILMYGRFCV